MLSGALAPAGSAFIRFAMATLVLYGMTRVYEGRITRPSRGKWLSLFFLGLTGVFVYNVCFFTGLQYITAGRASLIIALNPLTISAAAFISLL